MTKKLLITLSILTLFASCGTRRTDVQVQDPATFEEDVVRKTDVQVQDPATFDEGVVINGIRWATRNVDMPGTFAPYPESFGMHFQWNRKKGWSATDEEVEGWDSSPEGGTAWYAENDPCPPGWRVPTQEEIRSTFWYVGGRGITQNGVFGRCWHKIFLPDAGIRNPDGTLNNEATRGAYWSSTSDIRFGQSTAEGVDFFLGGSNLVGIRSRASGFSVRCVSK